MAFEFIVRAAIKISKNLFEGKNHSKCLIDLRSSTEQGFIAKASNGEERFVGRKEALEIAIGAGQKINKHNPKDMLLSEDLSEDTRFCQDKKK